MRRGYNRITDWNKTPTLLAQHRARMLHDVLPSSPRYRADLAECVAEYDAMIAREKLARRKKGKPAGISVDTKRKKRAA